MLEGQPTGTGRATRGRSTASLRLYRGCSPRSPWENPILFRMHSYYAPVPRQIFLHKVFVSVGPLSMHSELTAQCVISSFFPLFPLLFFCRHRSSSLSLSIFQLALHALTFTFPIGSLIMTQRESLEDDPWLLIEPDPGSFSQLCTRMGVNGVQVEPIRSLNRDFIRDLRPIYGIILLLRHKPEKSHRDEMFTTNSNVYFANQVVHDAYAMYAMLSVLLNREESLELGADLLSFKEFTGDFPPMLKGLSVTNSKRLKDAHNGVARRSLRRLARGDSIYHYISYLPIGGHLWELDGFKRGPLRLVPCTEHSWLDAARAELQRKLDICQRQQIPFSVWSVIEDRRHVYQRRLVGKAYLRSAIERQLDYCDPNWRIAFRAHQWEDEYKHALETERCKRGVALHIYYPLCRSIEDLPANDRAELDAEVETGINGRPVQELVDLWLQNQDDSIRLYARLGEEQDKHEHYENDTVRRQHDYTPFIRTFISRLVARGHLQRMVADLS